MKIGLVTDFYYPWIGGPAALVRHLAHGLRTKGHEVAILGPSATGKRCVESENGVTVTRVSTVRSPFGHNLRLAPFPWKQVNSWLDRERPDVVHVHHPFPLSATAVLASRRRRVPVAATNHTIPECSLWGIRNTAFIYPITNRALGGWIAWLLNRCAAVAAPTQTAAEATGRLGFGGQVRVISNGIDTERFRPGVPPPGFRKRILGELGADEDRPIVLYTGRLDAEKQMDVWLRTAATVDVPARFIVGGQGADRNRLEGLARELGIADRTSFIGYVSDEDLPNLYRSADIYFITSPVELQSISTLEATASGLPVVAVNAGALPEIVKDARNGYLFGAEDSRAASEVLKVLITDEQRRRDMGEESRKLARNHDLSESVERYEEFLGQAARLKPGERSYERGGIVWS